MMYKRFLKSWKDESNVDINSNEDQIVNELERSFSSIQSLNTSRINLSPSPPRSLDKEHEHFVINEQFQAIQLAQILEKTAFELRVFSNRKKRNFSTQRYIIIYF